MSRYKILLILIFSMLLGNSVVVLAADFDKGVRAYESGDYETALAEWTPLAEQGNVPAKVIMGYRYRSISSGEFIDSYNCPDDFTEDG